MYDVVTELRSTGINILPLKYNKGSFIHPDYSKKFDSGFSMNELEALIKAGYNEGIAVMHGRCNKDLCCLDIDEKNAPGKNLWQTITHMVDDMIIKKLVIEKTRSGGYHVFFLYSGFEKYNYSKSLATGPSNEEWIALRSSKNNCITYCSPSPGYEEQQGSLQDLQYLTEEEFRLLCDSARQLDATKEKVYTQQKEHFKSVSAPAKYLHLTQLLDKKASAENILDYLLEKGWSSDGSVKHKGEWSYLRMWRPGKTKKDPYSANLWIQSARLSVFSTSTEFPAWGGDSEFSHKLSQIIFYLNGRNWDIAIREIVTIGEKIGVKFPQKRDMFYGISSRAGIVWKIDVPGVIEWLSASGYLWIYLGGDTTGKSLIRVVDNIVYDVDESNIIRNYTEFVDNNYNNEENLDIHRLLIAFVPKISQYLDALPVFEENFIKDGPGWSYMFFSNGALKITPTETSLIPYRDLIGCVHASQIKSWAYQPSVKDGLFAQFMEMISVDENHLAYLMSALGYIMHDFKKRNYAKALMIIEDVDDQEEARGRSGKGILGQFIEWIRSTVQQDGRNYKSDSQFKMQRVLPSTQVYYINDPGRTVAYNQFYNYITDDWLVEQKGKTSFVIPFRNSPKILITTNYLPELSSDSDKDRFLVLAIKKVFGSNYTVRDAFGDVVFFADDWEKDERNAAIKIAVDCLMLYLGYGVIPYRNKDMEQNAQKRQIRSKVPTAMVDTVEQGLAAAKESSNPLEFHGMLDEFDLNRHKDNSIREAFDYEPGVLIIKPMALYRYCLYGHRMRPMSDVWWVRNLKFLLKNGQYGSVEITRSSKTGAKFRVKFDCEIPKSDKIGEELF